MRETIPEVSCAPGSEKPGWWRWTAVVGFSVAVLCLLAVVLGGTYLPRKNAARDLRARRQTLTALMASAAPEDRARVGDTIDCVLRGVFRDRLSVAQVAPLRRACAEALADRVITPAEVARIEATAAALCARAGGPAIP